GADELEVVGGGGNAVVLEGRRFPAEGSISAQAIRAGEPRLVRGAEATPAFVAFIAAERVERILVTAIPGEAGAPEGACLVMDREHVSEDAVGSSSALADQADGGLACLRLCALAERQGRRPRLLVAGMSRTRAAVLIADGRGLVRYENRAAEAL